MRKSFTNFWKRNLGFFRLAVISNLEYRFNYFTDVIIQPVVTAMIELTLWFAVFRSAGTATIGGYSQEYYLAYAIWGAFISRIASNWMYEFRMIDEVDTGAVNSVLVRPLSYFEYYLSQFLGYKLITTAISITVPIAITLWMNSPVQLARLPLALLLVVYYLVLVYTISFCITSLALYFNRVYSITVAKNLSLWLLSGELVPLDLLPEPWRSRLIALPFCAAVYLPTGYLTNRFSVDLVWHGFVSVTWGLVFFGLLAKLLWWRGMYRYTGQGA